MKKVKYIPNENSNMQEFSVDWNSVDSISEIMSKLRGRLGNLKKEQGLLKKETRLDKFHKAMNAIDSIMSTDLSHLVSKKDESKEYYVYAHCDKSRRISVESKRSREIFAASLGLSYLPFYIGKGKGNRYLKEERNAYHTLIRSDRSSGEIDKKIIKINIDETEALILESKLIDIFGLVPFGGLLINIDRGVAYKDRQRIFKEELEYIV